MQAGHIQESVLRGAVRSQAEEDEAQLVKASQQGDQDAFALLMRRHQRRIFNLSMELLQDEEDASASTQEAFLAAWQGLKCCCNCCCMEVKIQTPQAACSLA